MDCIVLIITICLLILMGLWQSIRNEELERHVDRVQKIINLQLGYDKSMSCYKETKLPTFYSGEKLTTK